MIKKKIKRKFKKFMFLIYLYIKILRNYLPIKNKIRFYFEKFNLRINKNFNNFKSRNAN